MTAPDSLVLLPPSEGKAAGGDGPPWAPGSMRFDLDVERERVLGSLRSAMRADAAVRRKLLGVKGDALVAATAANRSVRAAATRPASERYTGVLYDALDLASLGAAARRRARSRLVIFSGAWGLVSPDDPIPDYKLKMGSSLGPLGRLSSWWRPAIDEALAPSLAAASRVWNLLPKEHDAAWTVPSHLQIVTVRFVDRRPDGSLSTVSHWNKLLKGALVREIVETADLTPEDLGSWEHPLGYRLDPDMTVVTGPTTSLALVKDTRTN